MQPSDDFSGRRGLQWIVWIGLVVISGALWGALILMALVLYGFAVELMAVPA